MGRRVVRVGQGYCVPRTPTPGSYGPLGTVTNSLPQETKDPLSKSLAWRCQGDVRGGTTWWA